MNFPVTRLLHKLEKLLCLNLWLVLAQTDIHKELESNFHVPYKGGRENIPSLDSLIYVTIIHNLNQKCIKRLFIA